MTSLEASARPKFVNRRTFIQTVFCGAGAALAGMSNEHSAAGAEPVIRTGRPHMKLSLAGYSFNRFLPRNWPTERSGNPTMTLEDFIEFCAELNLDGCEPTSYYFPRPVTHEYLMHLKALTFRLGLDISGTAIGNDFCLPEGEARRRELELARMWIDYAAALGAPVIRIFAGKVPSGDTEQVAIERCIAGINESLEHAAQKGVCLALENHGGITSTPDQMLKIVEGVNPSPWFGVNFDSGNFRTPDPYGDLEKIAPYTINAQIKVHMSPNGKSEPADLERVVRILKSAGYRGYLVLEYEAREEPKRAIPRYINELRELISS